MGIRSKEGQDTASIAWISPVNLIVSACALFIKPCSTPKSFLRGCLVVQSCPTLCNPMDWSPPGSTVHGDSQGKNTGVGYHALFQGIVPTQELNPSLPHCRHILYCLSHQVSLKNLFFVTSVTSVHRILQARIPEWVAVPSPGGLPNPRIEPRSPALQADSLQSEPPGKPVHFKYVQFYFSLIPQ